MITLVFLISGCSSGNADLLDPVVCEPPCWRGITPGVTTIDEAAIILDSMEEIDHETMEYVGSNKHYWDSGYTWKFLGEEQNGGFLTEIDGKVTAIEFSFGDDPKLSDVVNIVGYPDNVLTSIFALDNIMVTIGLYYKSGICAEVYNNYSIISLKRISPTPISVNAKISNFAYFDNSQPIDNWPNACWYYGEKDHILDWVGYGDYEVVSSQ